MILADYESSKYGGVHVFWKALTSDISHWRDIDDEMWRLLADWNLPRKEEYRPSDTALLVHRWQRTSIRRSPPAGKGRATPGQPTNLPLRALGTAASAAASDLLALDLAGNSPLLTFMRACHGFPRNRRPYRVTACSQD